MVARPGPARYAFAHGIWPEWPDFCPKKGLGGAYFAGIFRSLAGDASVSGVDCASEDATARFSAILAEPVRDDG
jgi:hypothetical protein